MGREIRKVPAGWQHPKKEYWTMRGREERFIPLYDHEYDTACNDWWADAVAWDKRKTPASTEPDAERWYWDDAGMPPDKEMYRPQWSDAERTHFQIYETVSEGTPVSPVFASLDEMIAWMVQPIDRTSEYNCGEDWQCMQGRSREQAEAFAKSQNAPSFVILPGRGVVEGVEANELMRRAPAAAEPGDKEG